MSGAETRHRSLGIVVIRSVEEHWIPEEAVPEGAVEGIEERMPE